MKRMMASVVAASGVLAFGAAPASAGPPRIYHTITSSHGFAVLDQTEGCERTEVFVSSSVAMYGSQPGPVTKQGLTGVFVRVTDACSTGGRVSAAAGGGGGVLFEADGQNRARLVTDNRLRGASVSTAIPATDSEGNPVTVHLSTTWTPVGALERSTTHSHANLGVGNVNTVSNELRRPVTAQVSVTVAGHTASGTASEAVLDQTKFRCIEVPRPGVQEFFPCFGFPG